MPALRSRARHSLGWVEKRFSFLRLQINSATGDATRRGLCAVAPICLLNNPN